MSDLSLPSKVVLGKKTALSHKEDILSGEESGDDSSLLSGEGVFCGDGGGSGVPPVVKDEVKPFLDKLFVKDD